MYFGNTPRNYDFIPFIVPNVNYSYKGNTENCISGYLKVKFIVEKALYIGSGFISETKGGFTYDTIKYDGKCIIPGSSVKGVIRNICTAISDSCISYEKYHINIKKDYKLNCKSSNWCIVCDMFGNITTPLKSRISFSDFISQNAKTEFVSKKQQFSPNKNASHYKKNNNHIGYKFYNSIDSPNYKKVKNNLNVRIEQINKNSEFEGKIVFKNLTDDELSLLVYALGLNGDFFVKMGGFKAQGMGDMRSECTEFCILNKKKDYDKYDINEYKNKYLNGYGKKFTKQINKLKEIQKKM